MNLYRSPSLYCPRQQLSNSKSADIIDQPTIEYLVSLLKAANSTFGDFCKIEGYTCLDNPSIKTKALNKFHYLEKQYKSQFSDTSPMSDSTFNYACTSLIKESFFAKNKFFP